MQNMAAIQFDFKINSKLHTQVGQDANESVDKILHAIFASQNDEETILWYHWQLLLIPRRGYTIKHA